MSNLTISLKDNSLVHGWILWIGSVAFLYKDSKNRFRTTV